MGFGFVDSGIGGVHQRCGYLADSPRLIPVFGNSIPRTAEGVDGVARPRFGSSALAPTLPASDSDTDSTSPASDSDTDSTSSASDSFTEVHGYQARRYRIFGDRQPGFLRLSRYLTDPASMPLPRFTPAPPLEKIIPFYERKPQSRVAHYAVPFAIPGILIGLACGILAGGPAGIFPGILIGLGIGVVVGLLVRYAVDNIRTYHAQKALPRERRE
ncbi:MAG: hypothetical protein OXF02_05060 [Simkaniaceae bacterium]|nr:hypothetical protein [Simkaniaceae bacterium]